MSTKSVYKKVHSISVHDNKILLVTEVIFKSRMDQQFVLYNKMLFTINTSISTSNNMDKFQKWHAEWNKICIKAHSIYIKLKKRPN